MLWPFLWTPAFHRLERKYLKCVYNTTWTQIHCYILFCCAATIPVMLCWYFSFEHLLQYTCTKTAYRTWYVVTVPFKRLLFTCTCNQSSWPRPQSNAGTPIKRPRCLRYHSRWIDSVWKSRSSADALKENPINLTFSESLIVIEYNHIFEIF